MFRYVFEAFETVWTMFGEDERWSLSWLRRYTHPRTTTPQLKQRPNEDLLTSWSSPVEERKPEPLTSIGTPLNLEIQYREIQKCDHLTCKGLQRTAIAQ